VSAPQRTLRFRERMMASATYSFRSRGVNFTNSIPAAGGYLTRFGINSLLREPAQRMLCAPEELIGSARGGLSRSIMLRRLAF